MFGQPNDLIFITFEHFNSLIVMFLKLSSELGDTLNAILDVSCLEAVSISHHSDADCVQFKDTAHASITPLPARCSMPVNLFNDVL